MALWQQKNYVWVVCLALIPVLAGVALWMGGSGVAHAPAPPPNTANTPGKKQKTKADENAGPAEPKRFADNLEPSGVASVPGSDQVLIVNDRDSKNVLAMTVGADGEQRGDLIPVPLGVEVEDAEDITTDGRHFYVVGSQFRRKSGDTAGLVRFTYDPATHSASDVQTIGGLKEFLIANVPDLAASAGQQRTESAINIEGLAWDPDGKRLLFGLRNPVLDGSAIVVPVTLHNVDGPLSAGDLTVEAPIRLPLEGLAIRSIEFDPDLHSFLIIAGAMEGEKKTDFWLYSWNGRDAPAKVQELDKKIKPEGVTRIQTGDEDFLFVVGDAGYYLKLPENR